MFCRNSPVENGMFKTSLNAVQNSLHKGLSAFIKHRPRIAKITNLEINPKLGHSTNMHQHVILDPSLFHQYRHMIGLLGALVEKGGIGSL